MSAIELDGAYNVRDIGGLPALDSGRIRNGILYRADSLDAISQRDSDLLFRRLAIRVVIDVRSNQEINSASWRNSLIHYYNIPLIPADQIGKEPFPSGTPENLARLYLANLEEGAAAVRAIFEVLADHLRANMPSLVHCAAGRDRTGVIIAFLLSCLGIADEAVASDYQQSNRHASQVTRKLAENPIYANGQPRGQESVTAMPETIFMFLELLREKYQSPNDYAIKIGLRPETMSRLRAALIENPPAASVAVPVTLQED